MERAGRADKKRGGGEEEDEEEIKVKKEKEKNKRKAKEIIVFYIPYLTFKKLPFCFGNLTHSM